MPDKIKYDVLLASLTMNPTWVRVLVKDKEDAGQAAQDKLKVWAIVKEIKEVK